MKKYEYVHLHVSRRMDEHKKVIDEYARKGWRYVGFLPARTSLYGRLWEVDLVFEADDGDV